MEEESLQDCMAISSNGMPLEAWSRTDAVKAITNWTEAGLGVRHVQGNAHGSGRKAAEGQSS